MLQISAPSQAPELRDIHLPPAPSWWPPAPGWWMLAVLILAISIFLFLYIYKIQRRRRWRRTLLREFEHVIEVSRHNAADLATALSAFLRRLAMRTHPSAASLAGEDWLQHLDARIASTEFSNGVGRALIEAPYRAHAEFDAPALIALARRTLHASLKKDAAHV